MSDPVRLRDDTGEGDLARDLLRHAKKSAHVGRAQRARVAARVTGLAAAPIAVASSVALSVKLAAAAVGLAGVVAVGARTLPALMTTEAPTATTTTTATPTPTATTTA